MGYPGFHAISISFQPLTRLCVCVSSCVLEVYDMARKYKRKKANKQKSLFGMQCNAQKKRVKIKTKENKNKENRKKIEKHGRKIKADGLNGEGLF